MTDIVKGYYSGHFVLCVRCICIQRAVAWAFSYSGRFTQSALFIPVWASMAVGVYTMRVFIYSLQHPLVAVFT
jgi:hypothetical protein